MKNMEILYFSCQVKTKIYVNILFTLLIVHSRFVTLSTTNSKKAMLNSVHFFSFMNSIFHEFNKILFTETKPVFQPFLSSFKKFPTQFKTFT